jgi:hypothetical protein
MLVQTSRRFAVQQAHWPTSAIFDSRPHTSNAREYFANSASGLPLYGTILPFEGSE